LVNLGGSAYQRRSEQTSRLLGQLFEKLRGEGFAVSFTMEDFNRQYTIEHFAQLTPEEQRKALERLSLEHRREVLQSLPAESFTMEDFNRQYIKEHFPQLSPEEREEVLRSLPVKERLAGLSAEQIRLYLARLSPQPRAPTRKPRRKK
jgi:Mg/Co/Ni transporter MgtE